MQSNTIESPKYNLTIHKGKLDSVVGDVELKSIDGIDHALRIIRTCPSLVGVFDDDSFISIQTFPEGSFIIVEGRNKERRIFPYTLEKIDDTVLVIDKIINRF